MNISIDLGGTNIRAAQVKGNQLIQMVSILCPANSSEIDVLEAICSLVDLLMCKEVLTIGIGVPSILDSENGVVYNVANIASWEEVKLKAYMEERYSLPVFVDNDCNCFALGEFFYGRGKRVKNMVGITLGTGIGTGLVLNGQLYRGVLTGAGEVGCLPFLNSDYESYCSSDFFVRNDTTAIECYECAMRGEESALSLWKDYGQYMGCFMKAIIYIYAPELIVLGGGISRSYDLFKESMYQELNSFSYPVILKKTRIEVSVLPNANLLGASVLCSFEEYK